MVTTCTDTQARPLIPDDSNIDLIQNRFDIQRWTLKGLPSLPLNLSEIYTTYAIPSAILLSQFQEHQAAIQMDLSYNELLVLQNDPVFYNLQNTSLTVTGSTIGSESNILITKMDPVFDFDIPNPSEQYLTWSMTLENRIIVPSSSSL
jgi:hypothetical protein